ncbi:neuroblastoma-amplified sequence, partial [Mytilus galloprovincialis]
SIWTFLRTLGIPIISASPCFLPQNLLKLVNSQINWHIAIASEFTYIAILQDQCVEIRSKRDNFENVVGRGVVPRDPYPQWRQVTWSPDNTMVACSRSNGTVDVFDIVGTQLFTISGEAQEDMTKPLDLLRAVAGLLFTDLKLEAPWDKGFQTQHHFLFNHQYPLGISSIVYYEPAKILLVGGLGKQTEIALSRSMEEGVTAWRILSDYPYYKMVTDYEQDLKQAQQKRTLMKRLKSVNGIFNRRPHVQDGVFKLCISPDDKLVVGLHYSGKLTIWRLPSLKLYHCWGLEEQPNFDEISPEFTDNPQRGKTLKDLVPCKNLVDVNWWDSKSLILSRCTGAVTVSSTKTLKNLLGTSPEWFEPSSRVTGVHHDGFLGLEVECVFPQKRRLGDTTEEEFEDSDDEETSFVSKTTKLTKDVLYYVTDMERFQHQEKDQRVDISVFITLHCYINPSVNKIPMEHIIDHEEYGEALELAKAYGLDTDRVYQRQWKKSDVSIASIQDYLSKIKKRSWVFHECIERIPYNIDAMRELLEFGLKGTDLQALLAIEKGEDGGRSLILMLFGEYTNRQIDQMLYKETIINKEVEVITNSVNQFSGNLNTYGDHGGEFETQLQDS